MRLVEVIVVGSFLLMMKAKAQVITLPTDLSAWVRVEFSDKKIGITAVKKGFELRTQSTAGGMIYVLPPEERKTLNQNSALTWQWTVDSHPQPSSLTQDIMETDDYALRVGVILEGGKKMKLPAALKEIAQKHHLHPSRVVFYVSSSQKKHPQKCFPNPLIGQVLQCFRYGQNSPTSHRALVFEDVMQQTKAATEKLDFKVVGFWIFSDSDNSQTQSQARVEHLKWSNPSR